jgi:hypothetical protein
MTPQHLSVAAGLALAVAAPAIPETVLFPAGCYGIGAGQLLALALGVRHPASRRAGSPPPSGSSGSWPACLGSRSEP